MVRRTAESLEDFPRQFFDLVFADPPWRFLNWDPEAVYRTPRAHYSDMAYADLASLPVSELVQRDAVLVLWATWPTLPQALALLQAWGFTYSTGLPWLKMTSNGRPAPSTGYRLQGYSEPLLIGVRGRPKTSRNYRGLVEASPIMQAERREHSRKPDEVREWCRGLLEYRGNCLELFARTAAPGWFAWGNELDKFKGA